MTFDDGYPSYEATMDLLIKESISAIFFISLRKKQYWWDILSKILFENQHVEKSNYIKINNLLTELGCNFNIEESINFNLMDVLRKWSVTDKVFPFNRNKAFYLLSKEMEHTDHYKTPNMLKTGPTPLTRQLIERPFRSLYRAGSSGAKFLKNNSIVNSLLKSKVTKTGFFVIDLLFAGQAFADLFKPKDNLRTAVVDLFNAYNNLKY